MLAGGCEYEHVGYVGRLTTTATCRGGIRVEGEATVPRGQTASMYRIKGCFVALNIFELRQLLYTWKVFGSKWFELAYNNESPTDWVRSIV